MLLEVFTLYGVKGLAPKLEKELRAKKPGLFKLPDLDKFFEARKREFEKEKREYEAEKKRNEGLNSGRKNEILDFLGID